jgi:diaminohydroxyphosphoribosylaminopyrimidine deaminase / 5-amino-6-(5-phosphoribosylamino)uracil reductase
MAAALRLARKHAGLTGTNPAVGTLIVQFDGLPIMVGRGVTSIGGRPHAETEALAEAGERAKGATAYVTLEPCAHHGRTPPCAEALVRAGVSKVVGGANDPDPRVAGKGYAILRDAGIEVVEGVLAREAADDLSSYLIRSVRKRPEVILKIAVSADGMIGRKGEGQVPITGLEARRQVQMLRAQCDAILVGIGTVVEDDPLLTVRAPGLAARSPQRIVIDPSLRISLASRIAMSARTVPTWVAVAPETPPEVRQRAEQAGLKLLATETQDGVIALPELLDDLAATGISSVLVEGGAETARHFLGEGLVDRVILFIGTGTVGSDGVRFPVDPHALSGFVERRREVYGDDTCIEFVRRH